MITEKEVSKIATLAKLEVKEADMSFYISELEAILNFASVLCADEAEGEQSNCPLDFKDMREDVAQSSFERNDVLSGAKETENGFFKLRKRASDE